MCTRIQIEYLNSKALCATVGELIAQVGDKIRFYPGYTEIVDAAYCLCPVDFASTARNSGYACIPANRTGRLLPGDVIFRPPPERPEQSLIAARQNVSQRHHPHFPSPGAT